MLADICRVVGFSAVKVGNACEYLKQEALIEWTSHRSSRSGEIDNGYGKITLEGIKDVTGTRKTTSAKVVTTNVNFAGTVTGLKNFVVGDGNTLISDIDIGTIYTAIDSSTGSPQEKAEAKFHWGKVFNNATFASVLGVLLTMAVPAR